MTPCRAPLQPARLHGQRTTTRFLVIVEEAWVTIRKLCFSLLQFMLLCAGYASVHTTRPLESFPQS